LTKVKLTASATRDRLIEVMSRIRAFEEKLLELFAAGELSGTTHTTIGQEACAASLYCHLDRDRDAVFTNHRCHGHFLAYGGSMDALMSEIMGRSGGVCSGRGGSQHLCDSRFFSQGIQGGGMPLAAGYAHGLAQQGNGGIVVAHIGDGTLGEGVLYETLNIISLQSLPVLVILEHNGVAQSTDTSRTTAGDELDRFRAFGIEADRRSAADPVALANHLGDVVSRVRSGRPFVQVLDTFRLAAHSKGDDDRPKEIIQAAWDSDYLARLVRDGDPVATVALKAAREEVDALARRLIEKPHEPFADVSALAEPTSSLFNSSADLVYTADDRLPVRIGESLGAALAYAFRNDETFLLLGEDLLDPYGGAFKVAKGLSSQWPDRVWSTPISEAAITGVGNGYALSGGKAVVEIMFGDFAALAADQIINQAAKMHYMYDGKVTVPITIRLPSGGYRGYGPTHSQSLESRFCGIAGLKVVALSRRHQPERLLKAAAIDDPNPVLFVENKLLYSLRPHSGPPAGFRFIATPPNANGHYPSLQFTTTEEDRSADFTVVVYGGLTDLVEAAMERLILDEEFDFDYFILSQLSPLHVVDVANSAYRTNRLITVEEGPQSHGIGGEVAAQVMQILSREGVKAGSLVSSGLKLARVGASDVPIPSSRSQEADALPTTDRIVATIQSIL